MADAGSMRPSLTHCWLGDAFLRDTVAAYFSRVPGAEKVALRGFRELEDWGWRCATEVHELGREAGLPDSEPKLVPSAARDERESAWRKVNPVDDGGARMELRTSDAWKALHRIAAEEGLVASAFERDRHAGGLSRAFQFAKLFMFNASSGLYSCPLAMTDGAARLCEVMGAGDPVLASAHGHLLSRNPDEFWSSGQWMTEINGGSDVGAGTETFSEPASGLCAADGWADSLLFGYKWFSSATDARMAFTLARERNEGGQLIQGTRGLSLFYVEVRDAAGRVRDTIRLMRLKGKLGTRQLPTAELELAGVPAKRVGERGRGIAHIAEMMNITRLHNSISACSYMRRVAVLTLDYALRRSVFGRRLVNQPLARSNLAHFECHARASLALTMEAAFLLGRKEARSASAEELGLLRVLTPLCKLYTAKQVVWCASEGLEFFGGQGYIEATGIPEILRDSQVLPIWEGTTNVLCLDVLRAMRVDKGRGALVLLSRAAEAAVRAAGVGREGLQGPAAAVIEAAEETKGRISGLLGSLGGDDEDAGLSWLKPIAFSLAKIFACGLLIDRARLPSNPNHLDTAVAQAFCSGVSNAPGSVELGHVDHSVAKRIVEGLVEGLVEADSVPRAKF